MDQLIAGNMPAIIITLYDGKQMPSTEQSGFINKPSNPDSRLGNDFPTLGNLRNSNNAPKRGYDKHTLNHLYTSVLFLNALASQIIFSGFTLATAYFLRQYKLEPPNGKCLK